MHVQALQRCPDESFQTSVDPKLLNTPPNFRRRVRLLPFFAHRHRNPTSPRVHLDLPAGRDYRQFAVLAALAPDTILGKSLSQIRDQLGSLDKDETVVDCVPLVDVAERTADDQRDPSVLDGGSGLLSRGSGAKVVPRQ
jgi:hypothetical protein